MPSFIEPKYPQSLIKHPSKVSLFHPYGCIIELDAFSGFYHSRSLIGQHTDGPQDNQPITFYKKHKPDPLSIHGHDNPSEMFVRYSESV